MSSFSRKVNAALSQQKNPSDIQKEQESIVVQDVQIVAEYIREAILRQASGYKGSGPFVFCGYLKYGLGTIGDIMLFTGEETRRDSIWMGERNIVERTYQINQYGRLFQSMLLQELQRDGIQTSNWMVIFANYDDDDLDYIYHTESGHFTFLQFETNNFRSGPYLLEAPVAYRFTSNGRINECRYKNKKDIPRAAHVCIQINYRN